MYSNMYPRLQALAKMQAAAEKAKLTLSANKDAHPTIEGFYEDYDYRATVSRVEFVEVAKHLFARSVQTYTNPGLNIQTPL